MSALDSSQPQDGMQLPQIGHLEGERFRGLDRVDPSRATPQQGRPDRPGSGSQVSQLQSVMNTFVFFVSTDSSKCVAALIWYRYNSYVYHRMWGPYLVR